ncbi:hypothetical protein [Enterococcus sp. LJL90]
MKKKYITIIILPIAIFAIYIAVFSFKNTLDKQDYFKIPNSVDQVVITSANYSLPPEYAEETSKTYTSKKDVNKFVEIFDSLSLGEVDNSTLVGGETISVDFYKTGQKVRSYTFYNDDVLKNNKTYSVKGSTINKLLDEMK